MNGKPREYNIVCFSNIDWGFIFQRHQHLMTSFLDGGYVGKIIYVETLGTRKIKFNKEDLFRILKKVRSVFLNSLIKTDKININIPKNLYILSPIVFPIMNNFFYRINEWLVEIQLCKKMKQIGLYEQNTIAWINLTHPAIYNLLKKKRFYKLIYDCIDDLKSIPDTDNDIIECEKQFLDSADLVFATSKLLCDKASSYNQNVCYLPNAVSSSWVNRKINVDAGLCSDKNKKVIGYVGTVYEWFDLDLLYKCANLYENYDFCVVGPIRVSLEKFKELKNVIFIGKIGYENVEKYIEGFDVCLIPFKKNDLTLNTNPVKLYEYFSKGKPVVAIDLPELRVYKNYLYLSSSENEFIKNVGKALCENDEDIIKARREIALENTWEQRVKTAWAVLFN